MPPLCVVSIGELLLAIRLHLPCLRFVGRSKWKYFFDEGSCGLEVCIPDGVTGSQSDPLRNWSVLLLRTRKLDLCTERLVAL